MIYEVNGDLVTGMPFRSHHSSSRPEEETLYCRGILGYVNSADAAERVCATCSPLGKQKVFNVQPMRTEVVKDDGSIVMDREERPKLIKCTAWVEEMVVPELIRLGVPVR